MRSSISAVAAALVVALVLPSVATAAWPVKNRHAYISQGYSSHHRGIDVATPAGTPVVPILSGRVVFAGWKRNCGGYQVWIRHANGLYSAYYHLRSERVHRGQWVKKQQTRIGRVGSSGCAKGPHLHVEVWRGRPWASGSYRISPWPYIDSGWYLPTRYR
jgi:murein DD-endopeptidase MepM/ murein hydrolase activator NlpD